VFTNVTIGSDYILQLTVLTSFLTHKFYFGVETVQTNNVP
jgi:hypothetical protein